MSKIIAIQEGGIARSFSCKKLKTELSGGGKCLFVPQPDRPSESLSASENGVYIAADREVMAFNTVNVSVTNSGHVSGKGQDGNRYDVSVDDGGNIVETLMPSYIEITTPPSYTGPYGSGAIISFEGIVVTAYDASGNVWTGDGQYPDGIIPASELVFPVTVATYSGSPSERECEYSDFTLTPWPQTIRAAAGIVTARDGYYELDYAGYIALLIGQATGESNYRYSTVFCSTSPGVARSGNQVTTEYPFWHDVAVDTPFTYDGKTVYYNGNDDAGGGWQYATGGVNPKEGEGGGSDQTRAMVAWTILYGTITDLGNQQVPVEWIYPSTGDVYSSYFGIDVVPVPTGGDD